MGFSCSSPKPWLGLEPHAAADGEFGIRPFESTSCGGNAMRPCWAFCIWTFSRALERLAIQRSIPFEEDLRTRLHGVLKALRARSPIQSATSSSCCATCLRLHSYVIYHSRVATVANRAVGRRCCGISMSRHCTMRWGTHCMRSFLARGVSTFRARASHLTLRRPHRCSWSVLQTTLVCFQDGPPTTHLVSHCQPR